LNYLGIWIRIRDGKEEFIGYGTAENKKFPDSEQYDDLQRKKGSYSMNIQIFGTKKCNDTKKAERFFKERGIKFQFIDLNEKEMSKGEFRSVCQAVGGIGAMINEECKDKDALALVKFIAEDEREEKLLANCQVMKTPVVRNGKQATVGYAPDTWKSWV